MTAIEELNRLRRAIILADALAAMGITAEDACGATQEEWSRVAKLVRSQVAFSGDPSPETQRLTTTLLAGREGWAEWHLRTMSAASKTATPGGAGE